MLVSWAQSSNVSFFRKQTAHKKVSFVCRNIFSDRSFDQVFRQLRLALTQVENTGRSLFKCKFIGAKIIPFGSTNNVLLFAVRSIVT